MKRSNITLLIDSNPATGSQNLRNNGSTFDVVMVPNLKLPTDAENIYLEVKNATVWWSVPNVSANIGNNRFKITYNAVDYEFTIPDGLYSYSDLSLQIQVQVNNISAGVVPADVISLVVLNAENKIGIKFNYINTSVDFTIVNSVRGILGFNAEVVSSGGTVPVVQVAQNIANFNTINYFLVSAPTLLSSGLSFNSIYNSIIARIPINVPPNSQIQYDPRQTYKISANELAGINLSALTFNLTDDSGRFVDTRGEYWSVMFTIHYENKVV